MALLHRVFALSRHHRPLQYIASPAEAGRKGAYFRVIPTPAYLATRPSELCRDYVSNQSEHSHSTLIIGVNSHPRLSLVPLTITDLVELQLHHTIFLRPNYELNPFPVFVFTDFSLSNEPTLQKGPLDYLENVKIVATTPPFILRSCKQLVFQVFTRNTLRVLLTSHEIRV